VFSTDVHGVLDRTSSLNLWRQVSRLHVGCRHQTHNMPAPGAPATNNAMRPKLRCQSGKAAPSGKTLFIALPIVARDRHRIDDLRHVSSRTAS